MYPHNYFTLFPAFPHHDTCFVIMSFASQFEHRWKNVIQPALCSLLVNNQPQHAYRVDARTIGDSILTEILTQIGNARLVFADVTSIGQVDGQPVRNGNVMYEVGIAHAMRLPEEVILFRSDSDQLLFDVANVRVNSYDPDGDVNKAIQDVLNAALEALREVDLKRHLAVQRAAQSVDVHASTVLGQAAGPDGVRTQPTRTMGQALANSAHNGAIVRLLEIGALRMEYPVFTPETIVAASSEQIEKFFPYHITPFGRAILNYVSNKMGLFDPGVIQKLAQVNLKKEEVT